MEAYEDAIRKTATEDAPWYVVPADHKWFARLVVAAAIYDTMRRLDLDYPKVDEAKRRELAAARAELGGDAPPSDGEGPHEQAPNGGDEDGEPGKSKKRKKDKKRKQDDE